MVRLAGSFPEFASTDMKPPMFRKKEFESIVAAGIIKPEEHAQLVDGFIFVQLPGRSSGSRMSSAMEPGNGRSALANNFAGFIGKNS
jgi:hypothetical protein